MSNNHTDPLRESFSNIRLPEELDDVIASAVLRGQRALRYSALKQRVLMSAAAVITIFALSINVLPAFGSAMESIPVLGRVVSVLRIYRGSTGGQITDGQHVGPISVADETITIAFSSEGMPAGIAPYFNTTYHAYPYSLMIELHGVRSILEDGALPSFAQSQLVKGMYRVVTLDDSAQRYVITFTGPVEIEVKELADPAAIQIVLSEGNASGATTVYSVRTASYSFGEQVGVWESMLNEALEWQSESVRIIEDAEGKQFVEAAYFDTEIEAQAFVEALEATGVVETKLLIEQRGPNTIPQYLAP